MARVDRSDLIGRIPLRLRRRQAGADTHLLEPHDLVGHMLPVDPLFPASRLLLAGDYLHVSAGA